MGRTKTETPVAQEATGVIIEQETAIDVVGTEEVAAAVVVDSEEVTYEAELIPSGTFIAESGEEYEFTVDSFTCKGKNYTKAEALKTPDVLELLISLKSFILKQK